MNDHLREFWTRADRDVSAFIGDEVRRWPTTIWQVLTIHSIVQRGENLEVVECDACGDRHVEPVEVLIEPPGSKPRAYISCPVAGRVAIPWHRLEVWRIDFDAIANWIAKALNIDAPPQTIVPGRVWFIGTASFGRRARAFFLARGAHWPDAQDVLASTVRLASAPCPVIFCPNLLPDHPAWRQKGRVVLSMPEFCWFKDAPAHLLRKITEVLTEYDLSNPAPGQRIFRKEGQYWTILFDQKLIHLSHSKGMFYLSCVLDHPGRHYEASELFAVASGKKEATVRSSAGEVLDRRALSDYQSRAAAIENELQEARHNNDLGRKEALQVELDLLADQIRAAKGLGGRLRVFGSSNERARKAIAMAVTRAINQIRKNHAELAKYLNKQVSLGNSISYAGDGTPWNS